MVLVVGEERLHVPRVEREPSSWNGGVLDIWMPALPEPGGPLVTIAGPSPSTSVPKSCNPQMLK